MGTPLEESFCDSEHMSGIDAASAMASSNFDCSICLELSQDPVVTMCGHLFCWSCLHRWITEHSISDECPVCKACVKDKVIPLYGRENGNLAKLGTKKVGDFSIPRRPSAHHRRHITRGRPMTGLQNQGFQNLDTNLRGSFAHGGGHMAFSSGFGLFPALFGFHMVNVRDHSSGISSGAAYNSFLRLPVNGGMTTQQRRLIFQQEFVLYWFFILLACFTIGCFLLF